MPHPKALGGPRGAFIRFLCGLCLPLGAGARLQGQTFLTNGLAAYYGLHAPGEAGLTYSNVVFAPTAGLAPVAGFNASNAYCASAKALIVTQANWTWSAWVYPETVASGTLYTEGDLGSVPGPDFALSFGPGSVLQCGAWNAGYGPLWKWAVFEPLPTNAWVHVVLTLSGGGVGTGALTLFLNGVAVTNSTLQMVQPLASRANWPTLGVLGNGWSSQFGGYQGNPFTGSLGDVRVYHRALSAAEVEAMYLYDHGVYNCTARAATAVAVVQGGAVTAVGATDLGCGYGQDPAVRFIGGGGTGASARAVVTDGVVSSLVLVAGGAGYTNPPVVVVAPPFIPQPVLTIAPVLPGTLGNPVFQLGLAGLSPYDTYQVEFSPSPASGWTNLGSAITPTTSTATAPVSPGGAAVYFRLVHVP